MSGPMVLAPPSVRMITPSGRQLLAEGADHAVGGQDRIGAAIRDLTDDLTGPLQPLRPLNRAVIHRHDERPAVAREDAVESSCFVHEFLVDW